MARKPKITLVALSNAEALKDKVISPENISLRELLSQFPALSLQQINERELDSSTDNFLIDIRQADKIEPNEALYLPLAGNLQNIILGDPDGTTGTTHKNKKLDIRPQAGATDQNDQNAGVPESGVYPDRISEYDAVIWAYAREIESAASFLRAGLSVLVTCEKLVVEHLYKTMVTKAGKVAKLLEVPPEDPGGLMPRGQRQRQLAELKRLINDLKMGDVLVIPHLDLLAAGNNSNIPTESRELIELVYEKTDELISKNDKNEGHPILAFVDRSLEIPEVLSARFAVRMLISGVHRTVIFPNGEERLIGEALITKDEVARFKDFDPEGLYKNVAGMNPIRIRHAIHFAKEEYSGKEQVEVTKLYHAIRAFKAQTSAKFEVPKVSFNDIGGYHEVKNELIRALNLITGSYRLPDEKLRQELIPRGFIFYGPPGTGKTLFAKAIANSMNATIQIVSGPEVTDMYVGESERKVRELFSEARRNAPSVLVFDEFDSIATQRSGRDDGGSRAGNALVAQILTEMDGFRPEVPLLVIGTTNRLDIIDEALLRPSRFKPISIGLPTIEARRAIAEVHARHFKVEISPELLDLLANFTEGMNGDEIRSLFRDACVGMFCMEPPVPADAHRFGYLVGELRKAAENKAAAEAQKKESGLARFRVGERPRPTENMIPLQTISLTISDPLNAPGSRPGPTSSMVNLTGDSLETPIE